VAYFVLGHDVYFPAVYCQLYVHEAMVRYLRVVVV